MKNPFGDDTAPPARVNPFADAADGSSVDESIRRIEHAAGAVRRLKTRLGAEGLTISATRELIDEISGAMDAMARALKDLSERS